MHQLWPRLRPYLGIGIAIGLAAGALHGEAWLVFGGFWLGLMWPILFIAPIGIWYCARRQFALAEGTAFAAALSMGLSPWAWFDWHNRHWLNGNEIWFPLTLAFALGIAVAPMIVAARRIALRMAAKG